MAYLWLDLETYSEADVKRVGAWRYANDFSTEVILIGTAWDEDDPTSISADELRAQVRKAEKIFSHNAGFERDILTYVLGIHTDPSQWVDTAAYAAACGLPRKLSTLCKVLKLPVDQAKDKRGSRLISLLCKPNKLGKRNRNAELEAEFAEYNLQDVVAMRECWRRLPDKILTPTERRLMQVDMLINERGVRVDVDLAKAAQRQYARYMEGADDRIRELTEGVVAKGTLVDELRAYLAEVGCPLPDLKATTVEEALLWDIPDVARELLLLRQVRAKTGGSKFDRFVELTDIDGRAHDVFMLYGAHTWRWSAQRVQLHNMARPTISNTDMAAEIVRNDEIDMFYDKPMSVLNSIVRSCLVPSEGRCLLVGDYSQIEARIVPWLAGQENVLEAFRKGEDIYKVAATGIFRVSLDKVTKDQRAVGKVAILALGFGGGVAAFENMAKQYRVAVPPDVEAIVKAWRGANKKIVSFWYDLDRAFRTLLADDYNGDVLKVGKVKLSLHKKTIRIHMPNGLMLRYHGATINEQDEITYLGVNAKTFNWSVNYTWGGKLCVAGDAQLLTARGWKRLDEYVEGDLLWDGVEWCYGGKLIDQGVGSVVLLNGIHMTPDHEVLTDDGWRTAGTLVEEVGAWTTVSLPDTSPVLAQEEWQDALVGPMRGLSERDNASVQRDPANGSRHRDMRLSGCRSGGREESHARDVEASSVSCMGQHARSLSAAFASGVEKLRRARDYCLRSLAEIRDVLVGHGPYVSARAYARPRQQRVGLLAGELPMGVDADAGAKQAQQSPSADSVGVDNRSRGSRADGTGSDDLVLAVKARVACRETTQVYDIQNVGRRNRFVIRADEHHEPMIVHNCQNITEFIGRCILGEALIDLEDGGFNPVAHTHDEGICDSYAERLDEFRACMERPRAWAAGLPVACDCHALPRYRKM